MARWDPTALSWLQQDIAASLASARRRIAAARDKADLAAWREAQTHVLAARSALEIAGVEAFARYLSALEHALEAILDLPARRPDWETALEKAVVAAENFHYELADGTYQPLRLAAFYLDLQPLLNQPLAASDLFALPLPPHASVRSRVRDRAHLHKKLRLRFEKALADWLIQPHAHALLPAREALAGLLKLYIGAASEPLWLGAIALVDALVRGQLAPDADNRRLLRTLDHYLRDGDPDRVPEALWQHLAFTLARIAPQTKAQRLAHEYWHLPAWIEGADQPLSPVPLPELDAALRTALDAVREAWETDQPTETKTRAFAALTAALRERQDHEALRLAKVLEALARLAGSDAAAAEELAAVVLMLQDALTSTGRLPRRTLDSAYRHAQRTLDRASGTGYAETVVDDQAESALQQELHRALGELESALDRAFRENAVLDPNTLAPLWATIETACVVLDKTELLAEIAAAKRWIETLATQGQPPDALDPMVARIASWEQRLTASGQQAPNLPEPQAVPIELILGGTPASSPLSPREPIVEPPRAPAAEESPSPLPTPVPSTDASAEDETAELLAVFFAEAEEVLRDLQTALDRLKTHPNDREALTTFRRGIHTLKGSGRIVGLTNFGETAWEIEQTLNHWLQQDRSPLDAAALGFLSHLVEGLTGTLNRITQTHADLPAPVVELIEAARQWRTAFTPAAAAASPPAAEQAMARGIQPPPAAETSQEVSSPPPTEPPAGVPQAAADEASEEALPAQESTPERADGTYPTPETSASAIPPTPIAALLQAVDFGTPPERHEFGNRSISWALYTTFLDEARGHLDVLRQYLTSSAVAPPSHEVVRAAHTLAGTCGAVQLPELHDLLRALEHSLDSHKQHHAAPDVLTAELWRQVLSCAEEDLTVFQRGGVPKPRRALIEALRSTDESPTVTELQTASGETGHEPELGPWLPDQQTGAPEASPQQTAAPETPPPAQVTRTSDTTEPAPAAVVSPRVASSGEEEEALADTLDPELGPIFLEEGRDLFATVRQQWTELQQQWQEGSAPDLAPILRTLHTLKGSARMAGAMALGERLHQLEQAFKEERAQALETRAEAFTEAYAAFVRLSGQEPSAEKTAGVSYTGIIPSPAAAPAAPATAGSGIAATAPVAQPAAEAASLRIPAVLLERLLNEAGEIGALRSRVEAELARIRQSALDLTDNVVRIRQQLRELEIQTESQLQARLHVAETQHTDFDPLEMDRYTRVQELTRLLAESVSDVATLQQALLSAADAAEIGLHRQARQTREMQAELMAVRAVPVASLTNRLQRLAQQTAKSLNKKVVFDLEGGEVRVDRAVLDRLLPALEHLLRNAVAHGIELPEERRAAGKDEWGQITLSVQSAPGATEWRLRDDGRGLDYARILARAQDLGWVNEDETPSEETLAGFIFRSGFSTADQVSAIAGRGVGMDVVQHEVAALGGRIETHSTPGSGTTFLLRIPSAITIAQALLIQTETRRWAIPIDLIAHTQQLKRDALAAARAKGRLEFAGEFYPLRSFASLVQMPDPAEQARHWVVFLKSGEERLAVWVEALAGQEEIVAKPTGPFLRRIPGILGGRLLANGEAALILDPVAMHRNADAAGQSPSSHEAATPRDDGRAQPQAHLFEKTNEPLPPTTETTAEPPLVLVVDDSLTVRRLSQRLLERAGYRVVTAKDGQDALEKLEELTPDAVLSDIEMPRMDGFELLRHLRARPQTKDTPVIMITSRIAEKHRVHAFSLGANAYLGKPYSEEELLQQLRTLIPTAVVG